MDVDWKDVLNLAFWSIRLHDSFLSSTFRVPYSGGIAFRHRVLLWNYWNCLHYINKTSLFFQRLLRWKWNYFRFRYFVPSVLNCSQFYSSTWFDCWCIFHWSPRWDIFPSKSTICFVLFPRTSGLTKQRKCSKISWKADVPFVIRR